MARTNINSSCLPFLGFYTKKHIAMFILKDFFYHLTEDLVTKALSNFKNPRFFNYKTLYFFNLRLQFVII